MANDTSFYLQPLKYMSNQLDRLIEGRRWIKVVIALFAGIVLGLLFGPDLWHSDSFRKKSRITMKNRPLRAGRLKSRL